MCYNYKTHVEALASENQSFTDATSRYAAYDVIAFNHTHLKGSFGKEKLDDCNVRACR